MFEFLSKFRSPGKALPLPPAAFYNENLSPKYRPLAGREMAFGQSRERTVVKVQGPLGYPNFDPTSALTVQIFLRPQGIYNRAGLPGVEGYGLLEGD